MVILNLKFVTGLLAQASGLPRGVRAHAQLLGLVASGEEVDGLVMSNWPNSCRMRFAVKYRC